MKYSSCFQELTPRINITYKCPLFAFCDYCYSKKELEQYPNDMTVENFSKIITWFRDAFNIKNVVFLGGELTTHPELEKFSEILTEKQVGGFFFTNGCFNKEKQKILKNSQSFHTIIFHYEPIFFTKPILRNLFFNNLDEISRGKAIIFRFNTGSPLFNFQEPIDLSMKYNASIAYSFTSPTLNNRKTDYVKIEEMKEFVPQLIRFIKVAAENGIEIFNKRPLPLCIFNDKQLKIMKNVGGLRATCCVGSVAVNPDLSLIAAPTLTTIKTPPVKDKNDLIQKVNDLSNKIEKLKWEQPSIKKCLNCKFWERKECQGACTVYKMCRNSNFKHRNQEVTIN